MLELGAGTALPGLLLAKLGHQVTLSDSLLLPQTVNNCREAAKCNNLQDEVGEVRVGRDANNLTISWLCSLRIVSH